MLRKVRKPFISLHCFLDIQMINIISVLPFLILPSSKLGRCIIPRLFVKLITIFAVQLNKTACFGCKLIKQENLYISLQFTKNSLRKIKNIVGIPYSLQLIKTPYGWQPCCTPPHCITVHKNSRSQKRCRRLARDGLSLLYTHCKYSIVLSL